MIAIHTKYLNPTTHRGAKIKAYTAGGMSFKGFEATISYPDCSGVEGHFAAVKALIQKNNLEWSTDGMRYGDSADGRGYSFCFDASQVEKIL